MLISPADSVRNKTLAFGGTLLACVLATLYLAGYFFLLKLHNPALPPNAATPYTVLAYWQQYGGDPYTRHWLLTCLYGSGALVMGGACFVLRPVQRSLHGDSRFATRAEVDRADLFGKQGLILGRWGGFLGFGGQFLKLGRQLGAFCAAPPRSGKGAGLVQPNGLSWLGSFVVNDVRKECYRITAGWRSLFSEVYLFDPLAKDGRTAQWNLISRYYVPDEPALRIDALQKIANMLSPDPASGDQFWPASCRDLFLGLALYVIETPALPRTMGEVMRQIMHGDGDSVSEHWRGLIEQRDASPTPLSVTCKRMLFDFINLSPPTQSSVRKTFTSKLQLWANPLIDAATSGDSFDLRELRRKRMSIYVGVNPGDLGRLSLLLNLFFTQLYDVNMDKMPEDDPDIKYELLTMKDEFTAMGRMPIFAESVGLLGGYGIRPFIIVQAISQLRHVYGADVAETIMTCCGARVVYAPREQKYAEEISRMLGPMTAKAVSRSRKALGSEAGSVTTSLVARPLMNPDEVKKMGRNNEIVFIEDTPPILCKKIWYWKLGVFRRRANLPVPPIRPVPFVLPPAPPPPAPRPKADASPGARSPRSVTPADVGKLGKLSLTDYAVDFSKIPIPKGEHVSDDDLTQAFSSFQTAVQS